MFEWISFFLFLVAAFIHIGFFFVESVLFQKEGGYKIFKVKESEHNAIKLWALNQGFYNLFLALGMLLGLYFVLKLQVVLAGALTGFSAACMVGAGFVLLFTAPHLRRAALLQILPPLLGLVSVYFHVTKYL